jgi:peptidyl-prolyl cis-trans isomerase-like protein 2
MGKNQHSKDRLFLTATEHASGEHRGYGKQSMLNLPYRTLPYDCCAISFRPFETPLATADGSVFELLNIVPFLKKFRRHPVTGKPLAAGDLIKLHFHKNQEGQYACPVLYKPFTPHTHIVAIKPTGHVYCYDAVKQMNLKTNHLKDLLDETPFTRDDIIHIQDPSDASGRREMEKFTHVQENLQADARKDGGVRHNEATSRIMQQVAEKSGSFAPPPGSAAASTMAPPRAAHKAGGSSSSGGGGGGGAGSSSGGGGVAAVRWTQTTGKASASLTSTSVPLQVQNEIAPVSDDERNRQRYAFLKERKEKGYAQLTFGGHGNLNLELHCDVAPMACENFLLLLERGYYDRTPVHRLIKNFMVQCGDPTGTGTGGESAFGKPFRDEISNKFKHEGAGVLSMANSGPGTNGSQFFLTFKSASHLDGKHTIFGRVVGGMHVLTSLEKLSTDKQDRPSQPLMLVGGSIFVNPFHDLDAKMEAAAARAAAPDGVLDEERNATRATDREAWFNVESAKPVAHRPGIGRYIAPQHLAAAEGSRPEGGGGGGGGGGEGGGGGGGAAAATGGAAAAGAAAAKASMAPVDVAQRLLLQQAGEGGAAEPPKKRPKASGGFGNFSGW